MLVKPAVGYIKKGKGMKTKYMNPYLAGFFLGLVLLSAFFFSGRGLGASGAISRTVVSCVDAIVPSHSESNEYYAKLTQDGKNPLKHWLVFEVLGVLIGGFLSGALAGRLKIKTEHHPNITSRKRWALALIGGMLFGFGAKLGRGCTSGSALTGMAVLSLGGFITMMAIFGTGFMAAYFFRKNWI